jgi:hypothetical protein
MFFGLDDRLKAGGSLVVEDIAPPALPLWQIIAALMPSTYESNVIAARGAFLFLARRLAWWSPIPQMWHGIDQD